MFPPLSMLLIWLLATSRTKSQSGSSVLLVQDAEGAITHRKAVRAVSPVAVDSALTEASKRNPEAIVDSGSTGAHVKRKCFVPDSKTVRRYIDTVTPLSQERSQQSGTQVPSSGLIYPNYTPTYAQITPYMKEESKWRRGIDSTTWNEEIRPSRPAPITFPTSRSASTTGQTTAISNESKPTESVFTISGPPSTLTISPSPPHLPVMFTTTSMTIPTPSKPLPQSSSTRLSSFSSTKPLASSPSPSTSASLSSPTPSYNTTKTKIDPHCDTTLPQKDSMPEPSLYQLQDWKTDPRMAWTVAVGWLLLVLQVLLGVWQFGKGVWGERDVGRGVVWWLRRKWG